MSILVLRQEGFSLAELAQSWDRDPSELVYMGGPGPWANPFTEGTRDERASAFLDWLSGMGHKDYEQGKRRWMLANLDSLAGKVLVCECANWDGTDEIPGCHAAILGLLAQIHEDKAAA